MNLSSQTELRGDAPGRESLPQARCGRGQYRSCAKGPLILDTLYIRTIRKGTHTHKMRSRHRPQLAYSSYGKLQRLVW